MGIQRWKARKHQPIQDHGLVTIHPKVERRKALTRAEVRFFVEYSLPPIYS